MKAQWDLCCESCGEIRMNVVCSIFSIPACESCGGKQWLATGTQEYHPFTAYFDIALGREVTSLADRWNGMRENKLDYRDKVSKGDLSMRRDRIEQHRKEQAR